MGVVVILLFLLFVIIDLEVDFFLQTQFTNYCAEYSIFAHSLTEVTDPKEFNPLISINTVQRSTSFSV